MPTVTISIPHFPLTSSYLPLLAALPLFAIALALQRIWGYKIDRLSRTHSPSGERGRLPEIKPLIELPSSPSAKALSPEERKAEYRSYFPDLSYPDNTDAEKQELAENKELYHQLQNIEDHPHALESARTKLQQLLDRTTYETSRSPAGTILSIPSYTPSTLAGYFDNAHSVNAHKYEAYIARRKAGGPREIFPTREYAVKWLQVAAVVKYVDGGWVANALSVNTRPMSSAPLTSTAKTIPERHSAKLAFQVISEEFGDGDLKKNHVYVYHELMKMLAREAGEPEPPAGDEFGFDGLASDEGSSRCWTAAIAQQCIGLFASTDEYFPEALGFNMAYETLPYHLLVTSYELRELKLDDYYFALHITIDNPDSGHGALARVAVERFLEAVRERDGEEAMEHMWRRIQAGVMLADGLPTTPASTIEFAKNAVTGRWKPRPNGPGSPPAPSQQEFDFVRLLQRKAPAAEKMHCPSRILIRGHTIEHWLDPMTFTFDKGLDFLRGLAEKKPWVFAGQPERSRLMQYLGWGGRMFGAFSRLEAQLVEQWIDSLDPVKAQRGAYEQHIGSSPIRRSHHAVDDGALVSMKMLEEQDKMSGRFGEHGGHADLASLESSLASLDPSHGSDLARLAPVWFSVISLLDLFPVSPAKFATPLGCTVLRVLRAQLGFPSLFNPADICAGMDVVYDVDAIDDFADHRGLWEIGMDLFDTPPSSYQALRAWIQSNPGDIATLCDDLLDLRSRPYASHAIILGVTYACALATMSSDALLGRLSQEDRRDVGRIRGEVLAALNEYAETQSESGDGEEWTQFCAGCTRYTDCVHANQTA